MNLSKVVKNNSAKKKENIKSDKIALSGEGKKLTEQKKYIDIVKKTPDIRWDKVNSIKEKIKSGNYFESIDMNELADKIIESE